LTKDIFLERLIEQVGKWYDELNPGASKLHKRLFVEKDKQLHIKVLQQNYIKERFINCENLYTERVKFLTEVQEKVNKIRGI